MTMWFGLELSDRIWFMIEMIPVSLAFFTMFYAGINSDKMGSSRAVVFSIVCMWCSLLLIIAQGGWITAHLHGWEFFKTLMDNVWTIFNVSVMLTLSLGIQLLKK